MKISALEEYGLRVALQLAHQEAGGSLSIQEIAEREGLSAAYVGKLLAMMRQAGLVRSPRGRAGGYALARSAEQVSVGDVLRVFGGQVWDPAHCERHAGSVDSCVHLGLCSVRTLWGRLESIVEHLLREVSLADLVAGRFPWSAAGEESAEGKPPELSPATGPVAAPEG